MGTECSKKVIKQKLRNVYENLILHSKWRNNKYWISKNNLECRHNSIHGLYHNYDSSSEDFDFFSCKITVWIQKSTKKTIANYLIFHVMVKINTKINQENCWERWFDETDSSKQQGF